MQRRWIPRAILLRLSALLIACVVSRDAVGLVPSPFSFDDMADLPFRVVHARVETATMQPSDRACARTYTATILTNFKGPQPSPPQQKLTFGIKAELEPGHGYLLFIRPGFALYGAPPAFVQPSGEDDYMKLVRCNGSIAAEAMALVWEVFDDRVEIDVPLQNWPEAVPIQKIAPAVFVVSRAVLFSYLDKLLQRTPAE